MITEMCIRDRYDTVKDNFDASFVDMIELIHDLDFEELAIMKFNRLSKRERADVIEEIMAEAVNAEHLSDISSVDEKRMLCVDLPREIVSHLRDEVEQDLENEHGKYCYEHNIKILDEHFIADIQDRVKCFI